MTIARIPIPAGLAAAALLVLALAGAARAGGFVPGLEDIPLMQGLVALPQATLVYDKPDGRIVQSYAEATAGADEILVFYDQTLPQLGWHRRAAGDYVRAGERLQIVIGGGGPPVRVRFSLTPEQQTPAPRNESEN